MYTQTQKKKYCKTETRQNEKRIIQKTPKKTHAHWFIIDKYKV